MSDSVTKIMAKAQSHARKRDFLLAERAYQSVLAIFPNNKRARDGLLALEKLGFSSAALNTPQFQLQEITRFYKSGRYLDVVKVAAPLTRFPDISPQVLNVLAAAYSALGQHEEASEIFAKAVELDPLNAEFHNNLGATLKSGGQFAEAITSYQTAIRLKPDYAEAYSNLGNALRQSDRPDEAVAKYRKAIDLEPTYATAHSNLGNVLRDLGRLNEAINSYENALKINPDFADAHNNLGVALRDIGRSDDAVDHFRKAVALKPEYVDALSNLAMSLQNAGNKKEAAKYCRLVMKVAPDHAMATHILASFEGRSPKSAPRKYVTDLFNSYAASFDQSLVHRLDYKTPTLLRQAVDKCPACPKLFATAIDLGCGTGLLAPEFRTRASKLIGVDLSAKMIAIAREKALYDELFVDDVVDALIALADGVDLVLAADVLVYLGDLAPLFSAVSQKANRKAIFAFSTEHWEGPEDYRLLETGRFTHSKAYIVRLCQDHGFNLAQFETAQIRTERGAAIVGGLYILSIG